MDEEESYENERERERYPLLEGQSLSRARRALVIIFLVIALERTVFYYFYIDAASEFDYGNRSCNPLADFNLTERQDLMNQSVIKKMQIELINSVAYILPALGGILGDGVFGRYSTVVIGSVVYLFSTSLFLILINVTEACTAELHIASIVFAVIAFGLMRPNLVCLGCKYSSTLGISPASFFVCCYVAIGLGEVIGYGLLMIPQNEERIFPIFVAIVAFWLLLLIFFHKCHQSGATSNLLPSILKNMVCCAVCKICMQQSDDVPNWAVVGGEVYRKKQARREATNYEKDDMTDEQDIPDTREDAMLIWKLIWHFSNYIIQAIATFMAIYIFAKELTFVLSETSYMQVQYDKLLLWLPNAASVMLGAVVILLVMRRGRMVCPFKRTILGMILSFISFILSLTLKTALPDRINHHWSKAGVVFVLMPQTIAAGFGEAIAFSAGNEIAYTYSPDGIESFTVGVFNTVWGVGAFFALLLVYMWKNLPEDSPWLPDNVQDQHQHFQFAFLVLTCLVFINILSYYPSMIWIRKHFQARQVKRKSINLSPSDIS